MQHHILVFTRHNNLVMTRKGGFMPSPNEKLAESLDVLETLQQGNRRVFRSDDLSRVHRERLVENGFLARSHEGLADLFKPRLRARRKHAVACVLLGILRTLLRRTLWRTMAPVAGAVPFLHGDENGDPGSIGCAQSESDE